MIRFRMLGTLDLMDSKGRELRSLLRSPKLLALLGYLAIARPPGFHRRDTLVALLWPELDHVHARNALRQAVYSLRGVLGEGVLLSRGEDELGINGEHLWCDARDLEKAVATGDAERALELYGGGLLSGLHVTEVPEFERWLDEERVHVRRRACEAAQLLTDREDAAGNPAGAARWARRLTELSPSDETAVRRLIQLLDRSGDRSGAVRAYDEFERRLARDLELEPSPEIRTVVEVIRAGEQPNGAAAVPTEMAATAVLPRARMVLKRAAAVFTLAIGGLLASGWLVFGGGFGAGRAETDGAAKRLVVLPFANLGSADDAYFARGMTEELTARLAVVDRLRVIGSTSANRYRNTTKAIPEIGKELDVQYVLEGSVRWQKTPDGAARVRVTPQLVNAADGAHLWARVYDEPLDQIFRVQSDIAQKVVQALNVALAVPERRAVSAAPTSNLEAYDFFLRGNAYQRQGAEEAPQRAAARMYEKAVELDPRFALAYAKLSGIYTRMYWNYYDHSESRLEQAKQAVDRALELDPDLPEAHGRLGTYYGLGRLDYERALQHYAIAEAGRPNLLARAVVRMRQGRFRESLEDFAKTVQLDPASSEVASNYGITYSFIRDYPRAEAMFDRTIALAPERISPYMLKIWLYLVWDGTTPRARRVLDQARAAAVSAEPAIFYAQVMMEIYDRNYLEVLRLLASDAREVVNADHLRVIPRAQLYAQVYGLMGRHELARAYHDSAQSLLSRKIQEDPKDPRLRTALGIAYAGLGRKQEAVQEGLKAVELMPIEKEAVKGYHHAWELTRIYIAVGEHDMAIERLEYLLSIPGQLTAAWLRMDPVFYPLRSHPRFQRLVARK